MKRQSICLFRLNGVTRTMQTICTICTQTTKLVDQNVHWNIGVWVNHEMTNSSRLNGSYVVISWSILPILFERQKVSLPPIGTFKVGTHVLTMWDHKRKARTIPERLKENKTLNILIHVGQDHNLSPQLKN